MGFLQLQRWPYLLQQLAHHGPSTKQINITRDIANKVRPVTFTMHAQSSGSKVSVRIDGWLRASLPRSQNLGFKKPPIAWNRSSIKVTWNKKTELKLPSVQWEHKLYLPCRPLTHWSDCLDKAESKLPKSELHSQDHSSVAVYLLCSLILPLVMHSDLGDVLVSAGIELIFFLVAGIVLCFGFSRRIMLVTHWCF